MVCLILFVGPTDVDEIVGLIELSSWAIFLRCNIGEIFAYGPLPLKLPTRDYELSYTITLLFETVYWLID